MISDGEIPIYGTTGRPMSSSDPSSPLGAIKADAEMYMNLSLASSTRQTYIVLVKISLLNSTHYIDHHTTYLYSLQMKKH